jgi:hypothetical protein
MAAWTGGAKLLAPPPPIDDPTSPLVRFVSTLISRGVAAGATVGVVAILLAYLLLKATRGRPELAHR